MSYFVKFCPYNHNTLSNIINKTVRFSTVYEFNDFHELAYISTLKQNPSDELKKKISEKLRDHNFRYEVIKNLPNYIYNTEYIDKTKKELLRDPESISDGFLDIIEENVTYNCVGILCLSSPCVFCNDAANLMFAHYADNLHGIALIYKIDNNDINEIEYTDNKMTVLEDKIAKYWIDGRFDKKNMSVFLKKSPSWSYEKEWRMLSKPGIQNAKDLQIELKAILHTTKLHGHKLDTLKKINETSYNNAINIIKLEQSNSHYRFQPSELLEYMPKRCLVALKHHDKI